MALFIITDAESFFLSIFSMLVRFFLLYDIAYEIVLYLPLFAFVLLPASFLGLPKKVRFILLLPLLKVPKVVKIYGTALYQTIL